MSWIALRNLVLLTLALGLPSRVAAQNPGELNLFGGLMRGAIVESVRTEWRKVSQPELACMEQGLRQQGQSTQTFIERGIAPGDVRLAGVRAGCVASVAPQRPQPTAIAKPKPLPAKPTFDCPSAKSASGRILCSEQAGAKLDW